MLLTKPSALRVIQTKNEILSYGRQLGKRAQGLVTRTKKRDRMSHLFPGSWAVLSGTTFLKTLGSSFKYFPELVALTSCSSYTRKFFKVLGRARANNFDFFLALLTVNKMKLLVARSTIAIQNMLWIAIYGLRPQNIHHNFEIYLISFLLLTLRSSWQPDNRL